jgi:hypothetical protein
MEPIMVFIAGLPASAQVSWKPDVRTCTVTVFPVTFMPDIGDMIATCMCLAVMDSVPPPPIDIDELGIGIELDISGIGDELWPPPAADGCPEEPQAAAASASALAPAAARAAEPSRQRPMESELDMDRPPQVRTAIDDAIKRRPRDASKDAPAAALIAHPRRSLRAGR